MLPKPATLFFWTDGDAAKVQEPTNPKKTLGYTPTEKPSPFEFNWNLYNIGLWIAYLESVTDALNELQSIYDAIVGVGGTHATINDVMADMDGIILPAQDVRILVIDAYTVTATQIISKAGVRIDFMPRAVYSKGDQAIAIQIDAARCVLKGGRFINFSGGGDAAIDMTVNSVGAMVLENFFTNNTTDIDVGSAPASAIVANNVSY